MANFVRYAAADLFSGAGGHFNLGRISVGAAGPAGRASPYDAGSLLAAAAALNTIPGTIGDDELVGTGAADRMEGGEGDDKLSGGGGGDIMLGGAGADRLTGGAGADRFVFVRGEVGRHEAEGGMLAPYWAPDSITDFTVAADRIELYGYEAGDWEIVEHWRGSIIRLADGGEIEVNLDADVLLAHPEIFVLMAGPPPAAQMPPSQSMIVLNAPAVIAAGTIHSIHDHTGYSLLEIDGGALTNHGTIETIGVIGVNGRVNNAASGIVHIVGNAGSATGVYMKEEFFEPLPTNFGLIHAENSFGSATGLNLFGGGSRFTNSGRIQADSSASATGIYVPVNTRPAWAADVLIHNTGTVSSEGADAIGIMAEQRTTVVNSGTIDAHGGQSAFGLVLYFNGGLANSGIIRATTDAPGSVSVGVLVANDPGGGYIGGAEQIYVNTGTIEADIAFYSDDQSRELSIENIVNSGTIRGDILTGVGTDEVRNSSKIYGNIYLGDGGDYYENSGNGSSGIVLAGDHADVLIGGAAADTFYGEWGPDHLHGGAGDDFLEGGRGGDGLDGGAGFDIVSYASAWGGVNVNLATGLAFDDSRDRLRNIEAVLGSTYADALTGSESADYLEGLSGNDAIAGGAGQDVLVGGSGSDKLSGGSGRDFFVFSLGDGGDRITDFGAKGVADALEIHGYLSYRSIKQVGADVRVVFSNTDWISVQNSTVAAVQAALRFDPTPLGPESSLAGQATLQLVALTTIDTRETLNIKLADVDVGIIIQSTSGAPDPALFNSGTIHIDGGDTFSAATGVQARGHIAHPPGFINQLAGELNLSAAGATMAVGVDGATLFNFGAINVSAEADAIGIATGQDTLNSGSLTVTAGGCAKGIVGDHDNFVWNTGTIDVHGGTTSYGAWIDQWVIPAANGGFRKNGVFVNSGTIRVSDDTEALDSVGLSFGGGALSHYFNSGLIEADFAIRSHRFAVRETSWIFNTGTLRGLLDLGNQAQIVFNDGSIVGRVDLADGNDVFEGRSGRQSGGVYGVGGNDHIFMGAGNDVLNGGAGADQLFGGTGDDRYAGGGGSDIIWVGRGNDVITDLALASDRIKVVGYSSWESVTQVGGSVLVHFSASDSVLIHDTSLAEVTSALFEFDAAAPAQTAGRRIAPAPPETPGRHAEPLAPLPEVGTALADRITGTEERDVLAGAGGSDTISGQGGTDRIEGQGGSDKIYGGDGGDNLSGGAGNDIVSSGGNAGLGAGDIDRLEGGAGADTFEIDVSASKFTKLLDYDFAEGDSIVLRNVTQGWRYDVPSGLLGGGAPGSQIYFPSLWGGPTLRIVAYATSADDHLITDDGATVYARAGNDLISTTDNEVGQIYDDTFYGEGGDDELVSGKGDDILIGGAGRNRLEGGVGEDIAVFSDNRSAYTITTHDSVITVKGASTDILDGIEWLKFGERYFKADGTAVASFVRGTATHDALRGTAGGDVILAGAGDDTITARGADTVHGGSGQDRFEVGLDAVGSTLHGGIANGAFAREVDTVDLSAVSGPLVYGAVDNWNVGVAGVTFSGMERVLGGSGQDKFDLTGYARAIHLYGGAGNDVIAGGFGFDWLYGGTGNDRLQGVVNDNLYGEEGDDLLAVRDALDFDHYDDRDIFVSGGAGNDTLLMEGGDSRIYLGLVHGYVDEVSLTINSIEHVTIKGIGAGAHSVRGDGLANVLKVSASGDDGSFHVVFEGWAGDDTISGSAGGDTLSGQFGIDTIDGRAGDDAITGGSDADLLNGGGGADTFHLLALTDSTVAEQDRIRDFSHAQQDRIDLSTIDAVAGGGDDAFRRVNAFSNAAGELVVQSLGGSSYQVLGDVDGDGTADFALLVTSATALAAVDFIL